MRDSQSTDDTAQQAPPVWWSPTHGLIEVAHKRWPDDERLVRIADRRVIELPDDAVELRAVPAPAVDREGMAEQAFQIAYDAVDWNDTIRWVTPGPGEAAWTDVGTLRVQADEIVKQAVDALIEAGLVRAVDTAQDGGEHRG